MNRPPFFAFPAKDTWPEGWLHHLLRAQADGLSGHVHEIWKDLSDDSAWLGGNGEAWERGPYYLDGLVPLAWLLDDPLLQLRKQKWVEALLAGRRLDGNFGPVRNPDIWPRFVAMKALFQEYESSRDSRIPEMLLGYCRFLDRTLEKNPPHFWASARSLEPLGVIFRLEEMFPDPFWDSLVSKLRAGMIDWFSLFRDFPYPEPTANYLSRGLFRIARKFLIPLDEARKKSLKPQPPLSADAVRKAGSKRTNRVMLETHGVNLAMALKYPAWYGRWSGNEALESLGKQGFETILLHHGLPIGAFSGDEHLSGTSPSQGAELCEIAEMMFSFEEALRATGDVWYADRLEILAYNAFPSTFTPDMCRHQYVQQPNQIAADLRIRDFYDTDRDGNVYGLAPNYGCCLANLHQGFPKFALHQILGEESGIVIAGYAPCALTSRFGEEPFTLRIFGDYPFRDRALLRWEDSPRIPLSLRLRIPADTTAEISVNGVSRGSFPSGWTVFRERWNPGDEISLAFDRPLRTVRNADGSVSFWKGCLLLARPIIGKTAVIRGKPPFTDIAMEGTDPRWNAAPWLIDGVPDLESAEENSLSSQPFSGDPPPLKFIFSGARVENWKKRHHSAGPVPDSPVPGGDMKIELVPYGCTNLRISAFPALRK